MPIQKDDSDLAVVHESVRTMTTLTSWPERPRELSVTTSRMVIGWAAAGNLVVRFAGHGVRSRVSADAANDRFMRRRRPGREKS